MRLALGLVLSLVPPAALGAEFEIRSDDRVVFFGGRLVNPPLLGTYVEAFVRIAHPQSQARFRHIGEWREHSTSDKALARFDQWVIPFQPTLVIIVLGMDEGQKRAFSAPRLQSFERNMEALIARCRKLNTRTFLMTPPCPEPERKLQLANADYDQVVGAFADAIRRLAQKHRLPVIDWYAACVEYAKSHPDKKRHAMTADGIYPTPLCFALGSSTILEALHATPLTVTIAADWNSDAVTTSHGRAGVMQRSGTAMTLALRDVPVPLFLAQRKGMTGPEWPMDRWNRIVLRIKNAPAGDLEVGAPRKPGTRLSSESFAEGVNLAAAGPLTTAEATNKLVQAIREKNRAMQRNQGHDRHHPEQPELLEAWQTYGHAFDLHVAGLANVVLRTPRTLNIGLEIRAASGAPPSAAGTRKLRPGKAVPARPQGKKP